MALEFGFYRYVHKSKQLRDPSEAEGVKNIEVKNVMFYHPHILYDNYCPNPSSHCESARRRGLIATNLGVCSSPPLTSPACSMPVVGYIHCTSSASVVSSC